MRKLRSSPAEVIRKLSNLDISTEELDSLLIELALKVIEKEASGKKKQKLPQVIEAPPEQQELFGPVPVQENYLNVNPVVEDAEYSFEFEHTEQYSVSSS